LKLTKRNRELLSLYGFPWKDERSFIINQPVLESKQKEEGETVKSVLIVDDEVGARESLRMILKTDYTVLLAKDAEEAILQIREHSPDVILLDIILPDLDGLKLLEKIKQKETDAIVIMITATKTVKTAVEAMKLGAYDYVTKPFDIDELRLIINRALSTQALEKEVKYLRKEVDRGFVFENIIGKSKAMKEIFGMVRQIADSKSTVLIMGESGTGKELISRAIHYNSNRKNYPFVTINCAAIPETLIESELFGHEKGLLQMRLRKNWAALRSPNREHSSWMKSVN